MTAGARGRALSVAAAIAATVVSALLVLAAPAAAVPAADSCRAQDDEILEKADIKVAERSLLCLLNVHRVAEGVPPLPSDPSLAAAAREHSKDMVERHFYDHINPDGEDATARAKRHGYPGGAGENIYWRPLTIGVSPMQFFLDWQGSDANDENMLNQAYEVAGMGFALGTPEEGASGATGTQMFGVVDTDGKYLALDMLIPAECPPAREALKKAKQRLAAAKESGKGVAKAKRVVKKRKAAVGRACRPTRF